MPDAQPAEAPRPSRGGRPSLVAARARDERLLEMARTMFEDRGYEGTSMAALAEAAAVGKATLYARYPDKRALFLAVYRARVAEILSPLAEEARAIANAAGPPPPIETVLTQLGITLLRRSLSPATIRVQSIIAAEAHRFPELADLTHREGWLRIVAALGTILRAYAARNIIAVDDPDLAADLFLSMVIGRQPLMATRSIAISAPVITRVQDAVKVLLNGIMSDLD